MASKNGADFSYDLSHAHAVSSYDGNSYTYDANGNQVLRELGDENLTLVYDAENRLIEVTSDQPFTPEEINWAGQERQAAETETATSTVTETPTPTPTETLPVEEIESLVPTETATPELPVPTATPTITETPTETQEPIPTETPTPEFTSEEISVLDGSVVEVSYHNLNVEPQEETETETPTATDEPTNTEEPTQTETPTETPEYTPTDTSTPEYTETLTETLEFTETPTETETPTVEPTPAGAPEPNGTALYFYDGNGTMVKSIIGDVVTYYPSDGYQIKTDGEHLNERKYYAFGTTTVAMRENDEALTWLLTDQINSATAGGDTTVTASEDGTLVSEIKYTAFGEVRSVNGVMVTDNRYTGQREEVEIGLYYYVARFYDPEIAHFIQADVLIPNLGRITSYDRYAYVVNNPLIYADPTGLMNSRESPLFPVQTDGKLKTSSLPYSPSPQIPARNENSPAIIFTGDKAWTKEEVKGIKNETNLLGIRFSAIISESLFMLDFNRDRRISPSQALLIAFGGQIEFFRSSEARTWVGWGGDHKVTIYDLITDTGNIISDYIADNPLLTGHELGHVLKVAIGWIPSMPGNLSRPGISNGPENDRFYGFAGGLNHWQFAVTYIDQGSEIFADMMVGYIHNTFANTDRGKARYEYMVESLTVMLTYQLIRYYR